MRKIIKNNNVSEKNDDCVDNSNDQSSSTYERESINLHSDTGKNETANESDSDSNIFKNEDGFLNYLMDEGIKDKIIVFSDIALDLTSKFTTIRVVTLEEFKEQFFSIREAEFRQPIIIYGEACHAFFKKFETLFQFWFRNILTIDYDILMSLCDINDTEDEQKTEQDEDNILVNNDNKFNSLLKENLRIGEDDGKNI